ncbi:MAG TPA: heavy metal translocating P-type ATPase, partial [Gammaproteobacteria bacterium]|nr:heavy metal translocating P-type ATPase [Gammaproteobacteria bacterium]
KIGENSVLSSIQRLIEEAQHTKPAIAKLADQIASWFVSLLLSIAAIVAIYWYSVDASQWLEITIATLVVSCPCALSLATPTAITAASGQLAKIGLLPKRAFALETLAHATDFVFDKTGTLTTGKIELEKIVLNTTAYDEDTVLAIAASLETHSEHPIAKALLSANHRPLLKINELKHVAGAGIQGRINLADNKTRWFLGNRAFIEQNGPDPAAIMDDDTEHASKIYLADQEQCIATFILSDSIREESYALIEYLHRKNKTTHLMSGDRLENTRAVSEQLGITHYLADLKPEDKLKNVKILQQQGAIVVMTGDGVNDAPVLAGADLSIAIGKGTHLATVTADMVLISNDIRHIYHGYIIATRTLSIIRQNLGWALLYNVIAIPAAATGYVEPWLAATGMSLSSLVVVLNALRLNRIKF